MRRSWSTEWIPLECLCQSFCWVWRRTEKKLVWVDWT